MKNIIHLYITNINLKNIKILRIKKIFEKIKTVLVLFKYLKVYFRFKYILDLREDTKRTHICFFLNI